MSIFMETITDLLNSLIPSTSGLTLELATLNELLAYFITVLVIWSFLIRPVLKMFKLVKWWRKYLFYYLLLVLFHLLELIYSLHLIQIIMVMIGFIINIEIFDISIASVLGTLAIGVSIVWLLKLIRG